MEQNPDTFANAVLDAAHLPDYSQAELQPVASGFRRYLLYSTLIYWVPFIVLSLIAGFLPFISSNYDHLLAVPFALIALLIFWYRLADARHRGWALREHDLIAQSGVWWRSTITLPIARIQHVETTSGPVERNLGLARLSCYTAGGMTADLVVIALEAETADRLREHLLEQIRLRDEQDAEHVQDQPDQADSEQQEIEPDESWSEPFSEPLNEAEPSDSSMPSPDQVELKPDTETLNESVTRRSHD